ncbi:MAG: elongation factor P maturation arginine rhamnosyltransferase EarP [Candidimonas sp.]|nr:MAG: elongation factor P maturation arginine rhamnosyltransferase EarP [Candidimonas sp.]TAM23493.1 MAG: elongation factor P maturation arginine rhamnosyltransferase EarP [Candidimonas sp.]TAM73968.1 MAG: elongation factor P maturation arginine rhamnosyltransferase EarP [Candidimonas sp.]
MIHGHVFVAAPLVGAIFNLNRHTPIDSNLPPPSLSFDIFCRVVDNFGDIGVCWRLARQLADMPNGHRVRLWVDNLHRFAKIEARVDPAQDRQTVERIDLVHWTPEPPDLQPCQVVVEAFACDPPQGFIQRMAAEHSVWINLEYLSAEPWVESCHALASIHLSGLRKIFFFPGFTPHTGGLLREPHLLKTRKRWLSEPGNAQALRRALRLPDNLSQSLQKGDCRQVFLFCYPSAPALGLLQGLAHDPTPSVILVPAGVYPRLEASQTPHVHVHEIPFVDQTTFDQVLWSSDLNCVRGEDSLVRAMWAGKPFLWQIYPQNEDAHLVKLQAWLAQTSFSPAVQALMQAWNGDTHASVGALVSRLLSVPAWSEWQRDTRLWTEKMAQQPDLASSLLRLCVKLLQTG